MLVLYLPEQSHDKSSDNMNTLGKRKSALKAFSCHPNICRTGVCTFPHKLDTEPSNISSKGTIVTQFGTKDGLSGFSCFSFLWPSQSLSERAVSGTASQPGHTFFNVRHIPPQEGFLLGCANSEGLARSGSAYPAITLKQ